MVKKVLLRVVDLLSLGVILCAVAVLLTVLFSGTDRAPSVLGYSAFRVMTGSMEPAIPADSLIVVHQVDPGDLGVGDVISFYSRDPSLDGAVNTHRIVSVDWDGAHYYFTTRGDANNVDDLYLTTEDDLVGQVIFASYRLGVLVHLTSNPLIFIPIILLPLGVILLVNLRQTVSLAKRIAREEEEAALREAVAELRKRHEDNDQKSAEVNRHEAHSGSAPGSTPGVS